MYYALGHSDGFGEGGVWNRGKTRRKTREYHGEKKIWGKKREGETAISLDGVLWDLE